MKLPAAQRFRSEHDGIVSWHCLSAGPHYDPARVAIGTVVGVDEHVVGPGAGFDWHAHRGVHIVTWVLDGVLRHEDSNGVRRDVSPGTLLVQSTGEGIRHRETNASSSEQLRMIQLTLLGSGPVSVRQAVPPVEVGGALVDAVHGPGTVTGGLVFVTRGAQAGWLLDGSIDVDGEALVLLSDA